MSNRHHNSKAREAPRNDSHQPIACRAISLGPCSPQFGFQYCQAGFERLQQDSVIGSVQILLVHLGTAAIRTCNCLVNTEFLSTGVGNKTAHSLGTVVLLFDVCTFPFFLTGLSTLGYLCPRVSIGCPQCHHAVMARRVAPKDQAPQPAQHPDCDKKER